MHDHIKTNLEESTVFTAPIYDVNQTTKDTIFGKYKHISIPWLAGSVVWLFVMGYLLRNYLGSELTILFLFAPAIAFGIWWGMVKDQARAAFMRQFAQRNGFSYSAKGDHTKARGLVFSFGKDGSKKLANEINGQVENYPVKIANYTATVGSGKNSHTYNFTMFEVSANNDLPQFFLNSHSAPFMSGSSDPLSISSKVLKLEGDFSKYFDLYVPREYEQEALEIFTPDVMAELIDTSQKYDLEIVGKQIRIIADGYIERSSELEAMFAHAKHLIELLDRKLDRFSYQVIGDFSPQLQITKYSFGMSRHMIMSLVVIMFAFVITVLIVFSA